MFVLERIERHLWRRGFVQAPLRRAMRNLFCFSWALFFAGLLLLPVTDTVFWTGGAALLSCWNFYTLSRFVQNSLPASLPAEDKNGARTAQVLKKALRLRSYLRLFITGILMYISLVAFHADPAALAAGLSASIVIIPISLVFRH
ncbi:hypothetical protein [uncultured Mailhella sp.]|uniref:hypothetical protein n=1 Tax=uncultured Mailhella sp. TaxID=1981031 RepID=UPI002618D7E0|nr:hypothetical protein [uncultured Mailhella sp.]